VAEKGWQRKFDDRSRRRTARNSVHCARRSPTLAETVPEAERDMPAVTTAAETLTYAAERGIAWIWFGNTLENTLEDIHIPSMQMFYGWKVWPLMSTI
jgi:hypothetical protein